MSETPMLDELLRDRVARGEWIPELPPPEPPSAEFTRVGSGSEEFLGL